MEIPSDFFPIKDNVIEFEKFGIKVTLNSQTRHIQWTDQNATDKFVPPIVLALESEMESIIDKIIDK